MRRWYLLCLLSCSPPQNAPEVVLGDASAMDGVVVGDGCARVESASDDSAAFDAIVSCLQNSATSADVARASIATFVRRVEERGGFPVVARNEVLFVYVRSSQYDAEDDRTHADEDFSEARRAEPLNVAGDFNDWSPTALTMTHAGHGFYFARLARSVSDVRWGYKFVARDQATSAVWFSDPLSRRFQYDAMGRISFVRGGGTAGHLEWLRSVHATRLNSDRTIYVYVPPGYEREASRRYPVLYFHDGNNAFDTAQPNAAPSSWDADAVSDAELGAGRVQPFLLIAIPNNAERFAEYTHVADRIDGETLGGRGADFLHFVTAELKPLIDQRYRTRPERASTGIVGSSLGGLSSFYAGLLHPNVFRLVAGMSSTFEWGALGGGTDSMLERYRAVRDFAARDQRFYLDSGGGPASDGTCVFDGADDPRDNYCETNEMRDLLVARGVSRFPNDPDAVRLTPADANIYHYWQAGAPHHESAWNQRFHRVLRFFFPME